MSCIYKCCCSSWCFPNSLKPNQKDGQDSSSRVDLKRFSMPSPISRPQGSSPRSLSSRVSPASPLTPANSLVRSVVNSTHLSVNPDGSLHGQFLHNPSGFLQPPLSPFNSVVVPSPSSAIIGVRQNVGRLTDST
jgi:hypothetical protein